MFNIEDSNDDLDLETNVFDLIKSYAQKSTALNSSIRYPSSSTSTFPSFSDQTINIAAQVAKSVISLLLLFL